MRSRPRKRKPRKVTLKPARRRKSRGLNDDDCEEWMICQPREREAKK